MSHLPTKGLEERLERLNKLLSSQYNEPQFQVTTTAEKENKWHCLICNIALKIIPHANSFGNVLQHISCNQHRLRIMSIRLKVQSAMKWVANSSTNPVTMPQEFVELLRYITPYSYPDSPWELIQFEHSWGLHCVPCVQSIKINENITSDLLNHIYSSAHKTSCETTKRSKSTTDTAENGPAQKKPKNSIQPEVNIPLNMTQSLPFSNTCALRTENSQHPLPPMVQSPRKSQSTAIDTQPASIERIPLGPAPNINIPNVSKSPRKPEIQAAPMTLVVSVPSSPTILQSPVIISPEPSCQLGSHSTTIEDFQHPANEIIAVSEADSTICKVENNVNILEITKKESDEEDNDSDCEIIDLTDVSSSQSCKIASSVLVEKSEIKTKVDVATNLHTTSSTSAQVSRQSFSEATSSSRALTETFFSNTTPTLSPVLPIVNPSPFNSLTEYGTLSRDFDDWEGEGELDSQELQQLLEIIPLEERTKDDVEESIKFIGTRNGTPDGMNIFLMPHQVIGTAWMVKVERDPMIRGGILGDEMGLGKTIQTIATIVHNMPDRKDKKARKSTLIVASLALLTQWKNEFLDKIEDGLLSVYIYHGLNKVKSVAELRKYDIIITTYTTVANEYPALKKKKTGQGSEVGESSRSPGPLFQMKWSRVVLDEAQMIKNMNSRCSIAVTLLDSERRWCLTGTPISNSIAELFPLFRFLEVKYYRVWSKFNQDIQLPMTQDHKREHALKLVQSVLRSVMFRRTKKSTLNGKPILTLPKRIVNIDKGVFSKDEREFYTALETRSRLQFNKYLKENAVMSNYMNVLALILRLRQCCNHPGLIQNEQINRDVDAIRRDNALAKQNDKAKARAGIENEELQKARKIFPAEVVERLLKKFLEYNAEDGECPICFDVSDAPISTPCGHIFCRNCIVNYINNDQVDQVIDVDDKLCPICRGVITEENLISIAAFKPIMEVSSETITENIEDELDLPPLANFLMDVNENAQDLSKVAGFISSTKLDMLIERLRQIRNEDPSSKTIVFSQFTSMLDLIETPLRLIALKFCRYDGSMNYNQREMAVQQLTNDPSVTIMLVSLKCGGVGLNLTRANKVIMLDPWWNPAVEDQAIDRVHRIGQFKDVTVERFFIKDTVEDRILALQEKKRALAAGALGEGNIQVGKLSLDDLKFLFRAR